MSPNLKRRCAYKGTAFPCMPTGSFRPTTDKAWRSFCATGRAPIAASRLSIDGRGRVVYELTKPWGLTAITVLRLSPSDFLRRLAMLIPPPYQNLIRHWGAFASRSKLRPLLPPPTPPEPPEPAASQGVLNVDQDRYPDPDPDLDRDRDPDRDLNTAPPPPQRTYRLPWAQLMKRVLGLDPLTCKRCATPMVILAFISNIDVVRKILDHLNIPVEVLPAPLAHGPWPSQTTLDVLAPEPEPEGDRAACSSASGARAQLQPSLGQARGPPRR